MWGEMGWCGVLECGMGKGNAPVGEVWESGMWDVWIPPISRQKKSGLHPTTLVPAFFISPSHQTKSNPDMRNSKLAHIQAGF